MKTKDVLALKPGELIHHSHYGVSQVKEVMISMGMLFGVQILPATDDGRQRLRCDAGVNEDVALLEDSIRRLSRVAPEASTGATS